MSYLVNNYQNEQILVHALETPKLQNNISWNAFRRHFLPYGKFDGVLFQNIYRDLHDENNNIVLKSRSEEIYALKGLFS